MTYVMGESWCWNQVATQACPNIDPTTNYQVLWAREFRYDGARARYMNRQLNPSTLATVSTTWSDYDGDEIYGDFTVSSTGVVTNTDKYEPGLWRKIGGVADYLHNDHLGTLRQTSNVSGAASGSDVFTAFGERQAGSSDRFGYVGAWGYQSTLDSTTGSEVFPFLHVGARYYDPSSGRFLQRDPIGIRGGSNVYAYAENNPMGAVDPSGLFWKEIWETIKEVAKRLVPGSELPGALECAPDAVRAKLEIAKLKHIYKDHPDDPADPNCPRCKEIDDALHPPKKPGSNPAG